MEESCYECGGGFVGGVFGFVDGAGEGEGAGEEDVEVGEGEDG